MAGPYALVRRAQAAGTVAQVERYGVGDTPIVEFDVFKADGVTPVTPVGPVTVTLTNVRTGATVAGGPTTTITGNAVVVVLAAQNTPGIYRLVVQVKVDASTLKTGYYDFTVEAAE